MRLIDADELINNINQDIEAFERMDKNYFADGLIAGLTLANKMIKKASTVEVFGYTKNGIPLTTKKPPETLIDKVGPVAETATNFFEDETISGLLEEGEE